MQLLSSNSIDLLFLYEELFEFIFRLLVLDEDLQGLDFIMESEDLLIFKG